MFKHISLRLVRHILTPRVGIIGKMTTPNTQPQDNTDPFSLFHGNILPTLRTFIDEAATPEAHPRILPLIKHEHAELQSSSHKILISVSSDEQTRYQNQFTWQLARHLIGEELIVYPAIDKHVRGGEVLTNRNRAEHQEIKQQLKTFQGLTCTDPRFAPTLEALLGDLQLHMRREEEEDLVILERVLPKEDSQALVASLEKMKKFLPSRSHPLAPSKPPLETAVGLLTTPVDMIADLFRKWPHVGEDKRKGTKHFAAAKP